MAATSSLFRVETIVVDGVAVAFEDGSASLSGAAGFENTIVPSASGPDFASRRRVARMLRMRLQFGPAVNPDLLAKANGVQITLRDEQSGRRVLCKDCMFGSLGDVGGGSGVDITYNVLSAPQWL